ncbi:fluoride efflux transporter FluC [Micrococcus terreus]|uniref:fluoride efflux transporter FluC n=1 Tax=Micrococcus terreus TaxID=574650 RepID=UPI00254DF454|nr:CrcB family protein [Micrococcus terreus]MDK7702190.1 CrcB family protein [Micrococcus terreus]WOO97921.1 CrcB family protein [Micrococcus terreus]
MTVAELALWLVPLAGALGAVTRFLLDWYVSVRGVLWANLAGSFLAGAATALLGRGSLHATDVMASGSVLPAALIVLVGFTTALTTFSTVSVRSAEQVLDRQWGAAVRMWLTHLGGGLAAAVAGALVAWCLSGVTGLAT